MSRGRVVGYLGLLTVANGLVWTWVAVSPLLASWLLIGGLGLVAGVYRSALRATERALFQAQLRLSVVRPEERAAGEARRASEAEIARLTVIAKRNGGWVFPDDAGA